MSVLNTTQRIRSAWGDHLHGRAWSVIVTLTTDGMNERRRRQRRAQPETNIVREFARYHRRLEARAQHPVRYAFAIENTTAGTPHVHALLADLDAVPVRAIRDAWKAGIAEVKRYDARRGFAFYLAKDVEADGDSLHYSAELPPRLDGSDQSDAETVLHPDANGRDSTGMLALVRGEPRTEAIGGKPLVVERVATLEVVDLDAWGRTMAAIILRRAGAAA